MFETRIAWLPFEEADDSIRAAFQLAGNSLLRFSGAPPRHRLCTRCDTTHDLNSLGLSLEWNGMRVTWPMPVCPTNNCPGNGWVELIPASEGDRRPHQSPRTGARVLRHRILKG